MQVREIQLSNPTRWPLSYAARLEGAADFSLEASLVKIDPGQSTQVCACWCCCACQLWLCPVGYSGAIAAAHMQLGLPSTQLHNLKPT
jgi:hypothetical protein